MEYVKLGNTGLDVSQICLGCMSFGSAENWVHNPWALNEDDSRTVIKRALDLGINFFDTANIYAYGNSEKILGRGGLGRNTDVGDVDWRSVDHWQWAVSAVSRATRVITNDVQS